jgi:hypothetical protein
MSEKKVSRAEDWIAKLVRILSVPPIMATVMVLLLRLTRPVLFKSPADLWLSLLFLAAVPVLAYPVSWLVPALRERGRDGQRTLAFVFAFIGYICGVLYALLFRRSSGLLMLFLIYFFSALVLTVFNKVLHIRASGHASSVTGPIGYLCAAVVGWCYLLGALLFGFILWASVRIKRHTVPEFLIGSLSCVFSALLAWLICFH